MAMQSLVRKLGAAALLLLASFSTGTGAHGQQPTSDTLIVPGERVGPVRIGMNVAALRDALGQPRGSEPYYSWGRGTTYLYADQLRVIVIDNIVAEIVVGNILAVGGANPGLLASTPFRTRGGLSVASSDLDVNVEFGVPTCRSTASWAATLFYREGISVSVTGSSNTHPSGRVFSMSVMAPGRMAEFIRFVRRRMGRTDISEVNTCSR